MKRLGYFEKLSLAARWFLPQDEAESVVDDYKDILREIGGQEEAVKRFGPPWKPVIELSDRRKVLRWHSFLALLFFCALVPVIDIILEGTGFYFSNSAGDLLLCGIMYLFGLDVILGGLNSKVITWVSVVVLTLAGIFLFMLHPLELISNLLAPLKRAVFGRDFPICFQIEYFIIIGAAISMVYFGFGGKRGKHIKKSLILGFAAVLFVIACVYGFVMYCFYVDFSLMMYFEIITACEIAAVLLFIGALLSIIMAKMFDYRWRAVYILCIMGIVICFEAHNLWWNMNPSVYNEYGMPTAMWVKEVTTFLTWDLGYGLVLAAISFL